MTRLEPNDWRFWASFYIVITDLDKLSDRVTEAGEISQDDIARLAENVGHLKSLKPDQD